MVILLETIVVRVERVGIEFGLNILVFEDTVYPKDVDIEYCILIPWMY